MRVLDEERCRFCGFWHVTKERVCCEPATDVAEIERSLEQYKTLVKNYQDGSHEVCRAIADKLVIGRESVHPEISNPEPREQGLRLVDLVLRLERELVEARAAYKALIDERCGTCYINALARRGRERPHDYR